MGSQLQEMCGWNLGNHEDVHHLFFLQVQIIENPVRENNSSIWGSEFEDTTIHDLLASHRVDSEDQRMGHSSIRKCSQSSGWQQNLISLLQVVSSLIRSRQGSQEVLVCSASTTTGSSESSRSSPSIRIASPSGPSSRSSMWFRVASVSTSSKESLESVRTYTEEIHRMNYN